MSKNTLVMATSLVLLAHSDFVHGQPSNNLELVAVPAPGKVVIDGKLDDWDLSGSILSCPDTKFMSLTSVRAAAMYDKDGVYLSCRWTDPTPMENAVDPDEPGKDERGWMSDSLQIRIYTDNTVHLTCWYYKQGAKPFMHVYFGDPARPPSARPELTKGLENGAKMAFQKNADGKGYVQELFIPWKLMSQSRKAYKAGDAITWGLHFNWGAGDNKSTRGPQWQDVVSSPIANRTFFWQDRNTWGKLRFSPTGKITLPRQPWEVENSGPDLKTYGPVDLKYTLPDDGKVTLVIEDQTGRRVRDLISAYPRAKGPHVDRWDGLDDRGKPVAPGAYRWRGLFHPGIDVRYQGHLLPHTNPPWLNSDGTGGWGADHSAPTYATAHGQRAYLLYSGAESGSALIACDLNGNRLWGHGGAFQGGGQACCADDTDLYYASAHAPESWIYHIDARTGKAVPFAAGVARIAAGLSKDGQDGEVPTGIACRGQQLYLAVAGNGKKLGYIRIFDRKSGKHLKDLHVPAAHGLAFDAAGRLLAVSGDSVGSVDLDTGKLTPIIATGLSKPHGLAVGADGRIHVVNRGTNQIFTFTPDGNKILATGTPGGRPPLGKWDREGFLDPTGVGVDGEGNLWVAETDGVPRRLSKWGKDGKNLGEWLGPTPYGGDGIVDHRDNTRIYCGGLEFKMDWKTGKSQPVWTHLRGPSLGQPASAGAVAYGGFWHRQGFTMTYKGHDYLCFDRGLLCIRRGEAWVPCAAVGFIKSDGGNDNGIWSDLNEDGKVQENEIVNLGTFHGTGAGGWGTLWSRKDLSTVRRTSKDAELFRFTPADFTANGVPIFNKSSVSKFTLPVAGTPVDVDDRLVDFYVDSHVPWIKNLREHPTLGDMSGIRGYDRQGNLLWTYTQLFSGVHGSFKAPLPSLPGEVIGTIYVMGTADMGKDIGTVLCFNGYYGQRFLFTTDGLFVESLFKDARMMPRTPEKAVKDMLINDMSPGNESYAGTFSRNNNGDVYLTGNFHGPMCVISRVEGLDRIQRLAGGEVVITRELIAQGRAERKKREEAVTGTSVQTLTIWRSKRAADGSLKDWDLENKGVKIAADAQRSALAGLAYDKDYLYAAFKVQDNSPWRNSGKEARVIFLTGDSVDIQLGLDSRADPARQSPVAGDVRIAIAPFEGKPVVMLYQAVVPGHKGAKVQFDSPIGKVQLDRVALIAEAKVEVKVGKDYYVVEAAIPWNVLGGPPSPGAKLRGDVGVLFSDDLGTKCVLRRYWSNRNTNITSDLPSEIRFQPHEWGSMVVE